ncbi:MAG: iron-sulfur cluster assembly accessory protein [Pseudomonadota bacterium]
MTDMKPPITITDKAAQHIKSLVTKAPDGTQGLRLNVKSTGCSGNSYEMEYIKADESLDGDDVFEHNDASIYIPKIHSWMLFGMTVDFVTDDLGNARFDFINPNESGRCGCGESFHVDVEELKKLAVEPKEDA